VNLLEKNADLQKEKYFSGGETSVSCGCNTVANNFSFLAGSVSSNAKNIDKQK
jgi:hypothetical protein